MVTILSVLGYIATSFIIGSLLARYHQKTNIDGCDLVMYMCLWPGFVFVFSLQTVGINISKIVDWWVEKLNEPPKRR